MVDVYTQMDTIERNRMRRDLILDMFVNKDINILHTFIAPMIDTILKTYPTCSARMRRMLTRLRTTPSRSVLHAFIFFCMFNESHMSTTLLEKSRVHKLKFKRFYDTTLHDNTQDLLAGKFVCLQDYVETLRLEYIVT